MFRVETLCGEEPTKLFADFLDRGVPQSLTSTGHNDVPAFKARLMDLYESALRDLAPGLSRRC